MTALFPMHVQGLSEENAALLAKMAAKLEAKKPGNVLRNAYYEGKDRIRQMGIAVPPELQDINTVVGWPGMAVGVLEERLDWQGVALLDGEDDLELEQVIVDNNLRSETQQGHLESLLGGVSFVTVSKGRTSEGEPEQLITIEPPTRMTGIWSARLRRLTSACSLDYNAERGQYEAATLYLPDRNIYMEAPEGGGELRVVDVSVHGAGRVLVVPLVNQPRRSRPWGRSEITPALIGYTDAGVRTLLGMEVAREFYSSPQRYLMGADQSSFVGKDGKPKTAWETYLGRFLALERDEDGNLPEVGQFAAASPAPYIDQVKLLAQMVAGESSIPESYLGFVSANPSSADAIRASEARLVKRAERRQTAFGAAWAEVMRLVLLVRDGEIPPQARSLVSRWRDPATPTRAAMADAVMKLVSVGILPPDSQITYEQLGFDQTTIARLQSEQRRNRTERMLAQLTSAAQDAGADRDVAALVQAAEEGATGAGTGSTA
jgi:hypothetical protein